MEKYSNTIAEILGRPLELPNGGVLKNRLIKAAMSDSLGDGRGNPTAAQMRLYERWANGGMAMSLIGEVQTDHRHPEKPGNFVLVLDADQRSLRELARRGSANGAQIWPQLGHAGALSHLPISQPKGPSALDVKGLKSAEMSVDDIHALPVQYAAAARLAQEAGFGGVQIHAGHGFLFSQFLSPLFNHRSDEYGGSIANRFRIIREVIEEIRSVVGPAYPIAIKINSTDKLIGGLTNADAVQMVRLIDQTSVDLIDVSGGTYFPGAASSSDSVSASGPYFIEFAKRAKELTRIPIMLTGGFATRDQAVDAISNGHVDAVGLARAAVLNPDLGTTWLGQAGGDPAFPIFDAPPKGSVTAWYSMRLSAIGEDTETLFDMSPAEALNAYEARDAQRCLTWAERFG